ncbi:MAG: T9SS type A sorting domain-containing protein [Bacteroidetes bacterium]|nr:T9SS type A sorting domain-containing protein [Bacteroidota bacterium]
MKNLFLFFFFTSSFLFSQQSRIELRTIYSNTFSANKNFNVYFPPGYDSSAERYPVVYLFRGHEREWANDGEDASRRGNIKTVADSLIKNGTMGKVILIMPGFSAPPVANDYTYLYSELIPYVDKTFRTYKSRWFRGIDGFSLGGLTTLTIMFTRPELFSSIGSYDGTFSMFNKSLLTNASPELLAEVKKLQILFHSSNPAGPSNYNNNVQILNQLKEKGIENTFSELLLAPNAEHNWYFADLHMSKTFPLHYKKFMTPQQNIPLAITSPSGTQKLSETISLRWSKPAVSDSLTFYLFLSNDDGKSWTYITQKNAHDSVFSFNTKNYPDGSLYKFRVVALSETLYSVTETPRLTIDNIGNGAPYVLFTSIDSVLNGISPIRWEAGDPEDDSLTISFSISYDNKKSWIPVANHLPNSGTYNFSTFSFPNSSNLYLKLSVSDGSLSSSTIYDVPVVLNNPRVQYPASILRHKSGVSTAFLSITKDAGTPHSTDTYEIRFSQIGNEKKYSVVNTTTDSTLLANVAWFDARTEGPSFDGFHLLIDEPAAISVIPDSVRWLKQTSQLNGNIGLMDLLLDNKNIFAAAFPYDYEIQVTDQISDTSMQFYDAPALPTYFTIRNTTADRKTHFVFLDFNGDSKISDLDELFLFESDSLDSLHLSWHIAFTGMTGAAVPQAGDALRFVTTKPLDNDLYEFTSYPLAVRNEKSLPNDFHLYQNYPNPFNPTTTISFALPVESRVKINIYNSLGQLVETLVDKDMKSGYYEINFNASRLASGVYFYKLTSDNFVKTRKMLLIK